MIPKIIHYCWFGRGEMPRLAQDCIASWHRVMPDWEYKLWNEDNFDINSVPYVKEAYEACKYAFVSDYVRLFALYSEGGVYMDTDVEAIKPYDDLLRLTAFAGYEGSKHTPLGTGIMASQPCGIWVKEQLDEYEGLHFLKSDGSFDLTTNPVRISGKMKAGGFIPDGTFRIYKDLIIFPVDYFCPRQTTGEIIRTENTYCDHHFMGSWNEESRKKPFLLRLAGPELSVKLIKLKRRIIG